MQKHQISTEFKEKLLSSFLILEDLVDSEKHAHKIRSEAIKQFEKQGFPDKKNEAWKYTSLNNLLKNDFSIFPKGAKGIEFSEVKKYFLHEIDSYKIVLVDGVYSSHLSDTSHEGHDICIMSAALQQPRYEKIIKKYFNKISPKDEHFSCINTAFSREGAFVFIPKNKIPHKPIQIIHFSTGRQGKSVFLQPRNLVVIEENAQVQIIEKHYNLSNELVVTNNVTEVFVEKHAFVDYYKIQNDNLSSSIIDNTYFDQKESSTAKIHTFSFGGQLVRNNLNFYQSGLNVNSTLKGITLLKDRQHIDHHTLVHHKNENSSSHQNYKNILFDDSIGVFNGRVFVDKIAQKTNAFQQNNNILVGDRSTINAKPQLEIFADDVKCSHGCTIGQLDKEALFYFQSRGIPQKEARALLLYAFADEVIDSIAIPELKVRIKNIISEKLEVNMGFEL